MPKMDDIRQRPTEFDPFLYATVGEDRNGNVVTVLSTLARLGLEPWDTAANLAGLNPTEAHSRLSSLLARFRDVPALVADHAAITLRLTRLLPNSAGHGTDPANTGTGGVNPIGVAPLLAVGLLVLYIVQAVFLGSGGIGD